MPTDDTAISLESVAFEYLRGSAPRISIQATVTQDAGIAGATSHRVSLLQGIMVSCISCCRVHMSMSRVQLSSSGPAIDLLEVSNGLIPLTAARPAAE